MADARLAQGLAGKAWRPYSSPTTRYNFDGNGRTRKGVMYPEAFEWEKGAIPSQFDSCGLQFGGHRLKHNTVGV